MARTRPSLRPYNSANIPANLAVTTIPAPTDGLNAEQNLVNMPVTAALALNNFIVKPYGCETRSGSKKHVTGITGQVESLLPYNAVVSANNKMFACAGANIYDVTISTASPTAVQTGNTNARWESTAFTTPGGHFLVCANGSDAAKLYNGTTWTNFTQVGSPANPGEISGVNPNVFASVINHKLRLWFVEKDSTRAWYLPINSVGGAATSFDFGPYLPRGGYIVSLATWSLDAGVGLDDLFVAVTSEGDVIVYKGTDPSSSSTWSMVGVWQLAPPVSKKCFTKYAGDLLLLNTDGSVALSQYLQSDRLSTTPLITTKVQQIISDAQLNGTTLTGWQTIQFSPENLIIINIPQIDPTFNYQLVYNTIKDSWSTFSGWGASCWAVQSEKAYFGANGQVMQAFVGIRDNADLSGSNGDIFQATAQQAFNYFEKPGQKKKFNLVRLTSTSTGNPSISIGVNIDFEFGILPKSISQSQLPSSVWGSALWATAIWQRNLKTARTWQKVNGIGYAASLTVVIDATAKTTWCSTDWIVEVAGVL